MNRILLDFLYAGGLAVSSPYFLYKMATTGKYRRGLVQRLGFITPRVGSECIWLHGVSVGEILATRSIVSALDEALPGEETVLSATTNTGYDVAVRNYPDRQIFYYPLDFSWAVAAAFRKVRPRLVVLMEMEVWPNFIRRAHELSVPVIVANARITEHSFRNYRRFGALARSLMRGVDMYLVQNDVYAERLLRLGVPAERVRITGSLKFDTVSTDLDPSRREALRREMGIRNGQVLLIGGSTHPGEEEALLDAYRKLKVGIATLRLLVVPRHPARFDEVARLVTANGFEVFRRSSLGKGGTPGGGEVILGDTMGELEALYEAADIAFVGGSLIPHGGQNMLEPAAKGRPVVFGPSVYNMPQASKLLLDAGAALMVDGPGELAVALERFISSDEGPRAGAAGRKAVIASQGATVRTVEAIREILENRARAMQ